MRALDRLLPAATAVLGAAVLVGGGLAAVDQRRDADRSRAAAQQAYREQVRPLADAVFDQVQPLKEAELGRQDDALGGFSVFVDVARADGTAEAVRAQLAALERLTPPPFLRPLDVRLTEGLSDLAAAAQRYQQLPVDPTTGTPSLAGPSGAARDALRDGLATWSAAIGELYPDRPPPVPGPLDDQTSAVRRPVSRAGYLLEVGRACGRADVLGGTGQEEPVDEESGRRAAAAEAALVRELVDGLVAVPLPPGDGARLEREVLAPLREYAQLAEELDRLASSGATPERLFDALVAADEAAAEVAIGLGDYGSQTCGLYFGS